MATIADIAAALDEIAPNSRAQSWDNTGLLVGDPSASADKVLFCIDLTGEVLAEAVRKNARLIMAYHPPIFKPISSVRSDRQAIIFKAIANNIAIYSAHTAWDAATGGANDILADALGMSPARSPLEPAPADAAYKITVFMPQSDLPAVSQAAFAAGAGKYRRDDHYSQCAFAAEGRGSFLPDENANPTIGLPGKLQSAEELRWETICPKRCLSAVMQAITAAHSYEQPAIDIVELTASDSETGIGRIGQLAKPVSLATLISRIKKSCSVPRVLLADGRKTPSQKINTIAVGCGACGSMYREAAAAGADVFITGEMRHHDALAAKAAGLSVICTNHSNSERLTLSPMAQMLRGKIKTIKTVISSTDADPFEIL